MILRIQCGESRWSRDMKRGLMAVMHPLWFRYSNFVDATVCITLFFFPLVVSQAPLLVVRIAGLVTSREDLVGRLKSLFVCG